MTLLVERSLRLPHRLCLMVGLLASGCTALPSFGPNAAVIDGAAISHVANSDDLFPFQIVDVSAGSLPPAVTSRELFPESFRNQLFNSSDEIIAVGDQLAIRIWEIAEDGLFATAGRRETLLNVSVSNSGTITVPYASKIAARGLTTTELRALLLERFSGQAIEPEIAVDITETQSRSATVLGIVAQPGRSIIPSKGIRLLDLLAQAGGTKQVPWEVTVTIQRASRLATLPLSEIFTTASNNIVIFPGDIVNVGHAPRRFAVYGGVNRPSNIEIPIEHANLAYLLAETGGLNERIAQAGSVFVFRPAAVGSTIETATAYRFDFSRPDALLLAGMFRLEATDITYVASADAADLQRFLSIVVAPFLGTAVSTSNLRN